MTHRPLIAVVAYHLGGDRVTRWPSGGYGVPGPYVDRLRAAGARALILVPGDEGDPADILEPFDGLLLVGGGDVDPARYGGDPADPTTYGVEPDRDAFEMALLVEADRRGLPTLCICRGMQVMNVAFGGTLHQHLPATEGLIEHGVPVEETQALHTVTAKPGSRLASIAQGPWLCASHHHQGVDRVGDGLEATGWSEDGLVEAIERGPGSGDGWILGVQWHPEETAHEDPAQQSLFDALATRAGAPSGRATTASERTLGGPAGSGTGTSVPSPDAR